MDSWVCRVAVVVTLSVGCSPDGQRPVDLEGGNLSGTLHTFHQRPWGLINGFSPLRHASFPGVDLFRPQKGGIYFEHVLSGRRADDARGHFNPLLDPHALEQLDGNRARIHHGRETSGWDLDSSMEFTLTGDALDMDFRMTVGSDTPEVDQLVLMWAAYVHHARERPIRFWGIRHAGDAEGWVSWGHDTPQGFEHGQVPWVGAPPVSFEEPSRYEEEREDPDVRFVLPFYFGLLDGDGDAATEDDTLAYVVMFDQAESIRFTLYNWLRDGDGEPDPTQPAWDWQFVARKPRPGDVLGYRARLLVVPFTDAEDIKRMYLEWAGDGPQR